MFYENFLKQCNKKEISPSAAAEAMGYKRSVVTRWSKGTQPRNATLVHIAEYFNITVEELTSEESSKGKEPRNDLSPKQQLLYDKITALSPEQIDLVFHYIDFLLFPENPSNS